MHLLTAAVAERIFPGAVALIARDGATLHHVACGTTMYDDLGSEPVAPDTIYDIASLTKVFTATAALRLADAGLIDLDRPAAHYLPGLRAAQVTVRHLLTHTSGLDLRLSVLRERGAAGIRSAAYAVTPADPPGRSLAYTNINSLLLGDLVAAAYGAPLDEAIYDLLLRHLAMMQTRFRPPARLHPQIVPTEWDHAWRGGLVRGAVHDESAHALGGVAGHAGLFSTAADLERLLRMWLQGGAFAGRQILRESTVAAALRDYTAGLPSASGRPLRSGLGWMLDRDNFMGAAPAGSFGHTGFTGPAIVGIPGRRLAIVVLSNRTYPLRTPPPYRHHRVTADLVEYALAM